MLAFVAQLVLTAILMLVVSGLVRGVETRGFGSALAAAVVLGLANAFVKPLIVFFTLPISIITLGLFLLVINAVMWMLVSALVPGFRVRSFGAAFFGALLFTILNTVVGLLF